MERIADSDPEANSSHKGGIKTCLLPASQRLVDLSNRHEYLEIVASLNTGYDGPGLFEVNILCGEDVDFLLKSLNL